MVPILLTIPVALLQTSLFEWVYHRYWLHRPWLPPQMFTAHTLIHHQLCKHEDTFHVTEEEQEEALTFQWWGGTVLISILLSPWVIASLVLYANGFQLPYAQVLGTMAVVGFGYYIAYEGLHFLMHKPTVPWIENSRFFQFIKNHHRLHHVYMGKNFNVVLPLADVMLGTLVLRDPQPARTTGPDAKRIARRHSVWGRRMRAEGLEPESTHAEASPAKAPSREREPEPAETIDR